MGECKLCLVTKMLVYKSHIIPNFLYKIHALDENYKMLHFNARTRNRLRTVQTGIFDNHILCDTCEGRIGKFEAYAKKLLYPAKEDLTGNYELMNQYENFKFENIRNIKVDYNKFKSFLISILWKMNISIKNEYKDIELGLHEKKFRGYLNGEIELKSDDFPCVIYKLNGYKHLDDVIMQPQKHKSRRDGTIYYFLIGEYLFTFFMSPNGLLPEEVEHCAITEFGTMAIPLIKKSHTKKIIDGWISWDPDKQEERYKNMGWI